MGWIRDRCMKRGGSINNNPKNNGSGNGPLRAIVGVLYTANDAFFGKDVVRFECGHEGQATHYAKRGRCKSCKEATNEPN